MTVGDMDEFVLPSTYMQLVNVNADGVVVFVTSVVETENPQTLLTTLFEAGEYGPFQVANPHSTPLWDAEVRVLRIVDRQGAPVYLDLQDCLDVIRRTDTWYIRTVKDIVPLPRE